MWRGGSSRVGLSWASNAQARLVPRLIASAAGAFIGRLVGGADRKFQDYLHAFGDAQAVAKSILEKLVGV